MKRFIELAALMGVVAFAACGDDGGAGTGGITTIFETSAEPPGDNCANGGTRVDIGTDSNLNGTLDEDEIDDTVYTCSGADGETGETGPNGSDGEGFITLVETSDEAPGANCADGGQRIDYGIDDDADGTLDVGEIDGTAFICNGAPGLTTLVVTSIETAGANCAAGGARLDHGVDDSGDGVLDDIEIDGSTFICNGVDGIDGLQTLVTTSDEGAGANCADGGQRIDQGLDDSGDGVLDADEIDSTAFVCNGADGVDGFDALVSVSPEAPGANCIAGGSKIDAGTDTSDDGVLDADEITSTSFACDGLQSLVFSSAVAAGGACGTETGSQLDMGLDLNNDGALQAGEITSTAVICDGAAGSDGANGADGADGADGLEALVLQTAIAAGGACGSATGVQVDSGLDVDRSGVLEAGEITDTTILCNGADGADGANGADGAPGNDGFTSLILLTAEPAGGACAAGGTRIDSGIDNGDGGEVAGDSLLGVGEIDQTAFVCNSDPGPVGPFTQLTVNNLTLDNCTALIRDQDPFGGDDRGGVSIANGEVFFATDGGTSHFDSELSAGGTDPNLVILDAMVSPVGSGPLLALSTDGGATAFDDGLVVNGGGVAAFDAIVAFDPVDTSISLGSLPLSQPISVTGNQNGLFAGPDFAILMTDAEYFHIDVNTGDVTNLGPRTPGAIVPQLCENWAIGGVAEFDGVDFSILFRAPQAEGNLIRRNIVGTPQVDLAFDLGPDNPLSDMCAFTVEPNTQRWYFHYEGISSLLGGINENAAFCDADVFVN